MSVITLYRSSDLHLFRNRARPADASVLVVCFQYLLKTPDLDCEGFAQEFFVERGMDAIFVNCISNEWYQYPDLSDALACVRVESELRRTITYGSSMGGYAALRFAEAIGADVSIAVAPQYSPRSSVMPLEHRYDALICNTVFLHEDLYRLSTCTRNYVIYDPLLPIDAAHVERYRKDGAIERIRIARGGHIPTALLSAFGLLTAVLQQLIDSTFDPARLRLALRCERRRHAEHWQQITTQIGACDRGNASHLIAQPTSCR